MAKLPPAHCACAENKLPPQEEEEEEAYIRTSKIDLNEKGSTRRKEEKMKTTHGEISDVQIV